MASDIAIYCDSDHIRTVQNLGSCGPLRWQSIETIQPSDVTGNNVIFIFDKNLKKFLGKRGNRQWMDFLADIAGQGKESNCGLLHYVILYDLDEGELETATDWFDGLEMVTVKGSESLLCIIRNRVLAGGNTGPYSLDRAAARELTDATIQSESPLTNVKELVVCLPEISDKKEPFSLTRNPSEHSEQNQNSPVNDGRNNTSPLENESFPQQMPREAPSDRYSIPPHMADMTGGSLSNRPPIEWSSPGQSMHRLPLSLLSSHHSANHVEAGLLPSIGVPSEGVKNFSSGRSINQANSQSPEYRQMNIRPEIVDRNPSDIGPNQEVPGPAQSGVYPGAVSSQVIPASPQMADMAQSGVYPGAVSSRHVVTPASQQTLHMALSQFPASVSPSSFVSSYVRGTDTDDGLRHTRSISSAGLGPDYPWQGSITEQPNPLHLNTSQQGFGETSNNTSWNDMRFAGLPCRPAQLSLSQEGNPASLPLRNAQPNSTDTSSNRVREIPSQLNNFNLPPSWEDNRGYHDPMSQACSCRGAMAHHHNPNGYRLNDGQMMSGPRYNIAADMINNGQASSNSMDDTMVGDLPIDMLDYIASEMDITVPNNFRRLAALHGYLHSEVDRIDRNKSITSPFKHLLKQGRFSDYTFPQLKTDLEKLPRYDILRHLKNGTYTHGPNARY